MADNEYYDAVRKILASTSPETMKKFERLTTDESRVTFVVQSNSIGSLVKSALHVDPIVSADQKSSTRGRQQRSASSVSSTSGLSNRKSTSKSSTSSVESVSTGCRDTGKSLEDARKYRQRGNELYEKGRLSDALEYYTRSVLTAPVSAQADDVDDDISGSDQSVSNTLHEQPASKTITRQKSETASASGTDASNGEYVLALGNRSACLVQLKRYDECLRDIDIALARGYPTALRYKLLDRRARALIETSRYAEAVDTLQSLLDVALPASRLESDKRSAVARGTEKKLNFCTSAMVSSKDASSSSSPPTSPSATIVVEPPTVSGSKNERFPGASDALDIRYDPAMGRHGVTTRDVAVGEVMLVEAPFVSVLNADQFKVRCYGCFKNNVGAPIGCYQCANVRYCSESCRRQSWKLHHGLECRYLDQLVNSCTGSLSLIVVKLLAMTGLKKLLKFNSRCQNNSEDARFQSLPTNSAGVYQTGYASVYGLLGHSDERTPSDLLQYTLLAVWITNILRQAGFFDDDKHFAKVGGTVLRFLQIVSCNAIEIVEMTVGESLDKCHPASIGLALYPTVCLLNHSCDPVAEVNFYDDRCAVRAVQMIRVGQQVAIDYGYVYYTMPIEKRRKALSHQYFFDCCCAPCRDGWPLKSALKIGVPVMKCTECGAALPMLLETGPTSSVITGGPVDCENCGTRAVPSLSERLNELATSQSKAERAIKEARRFNVDQAAVAALEGHLTLVERYAVAPYFADYVVCLSTLKQIYRMQANRQK